MAILIYIHAIAWLHNAITPEPLQFHVVSVDVGQLAIPMPFVGFEFAHICCFLQQVLLGATTRFGGSFEGARIFRFVGYDQPTVTLNLIVFELALIFKNNFLIFEYLQGTLAK